MLTKKEEAIMRQWWLDRREEVYRAFGISPEKICENRPPRRADILWEDVESEFARRINADFVHRWTDDLTPAKQQAMEEPLTLEKQQEIVRAAIQAAFALNMEIESSTRVRLLRGRNYRWDRTRLSKRATAGSCSASPPRYRALRHAIGKAHSDRDIRNVCRLYGVGKLDVLPSAIRAAASRPDIPIKLATRSDKT